MNYRLLKFIITALILFILTITVFRWLILFIFAGLSLPFFLIARIVEINFNNLSDVLDIGFLHFKLNIYPTPFPIVYMSQEFAPHYKNLRFILISLANLFSFLFFLTLLIKLASLQLKFRLSKLKPKSWHFDSPKFRKRVKLLFAFFVFFTFFLSTFLILPLYRIYTSFQKITILTKGAAVFSTDQDFPQSKKRLLSLKAEVKIAQGNLKYLFWLKPLPFLKNYHNDAESLFLAADYALDSGLQVIEIIPTINPDSLVEIDKFVPLLEKVLNNISLAQKEIKKIDAKRYPQKIANKPVGEKIVQVQTKIEKIETKKFQTLIKILPKLFGYDSPRYYLVFFQNENGIKPSGEKIASFGIFEIKRGKIAPLDSQAFWSKNSSPDFPRFLENLRMIYQTSYGRVSPDGIIVVDRILIANLLKVFGPTVVYEKVLTAEGVAGEIEQLAKSRPREIIGVVLNAVLLKSLSSPAKDWPDLGQTLWQGLNQKHLIFYFVSAKEQELFEATGFTSY